jgi:hypothetical protein
VTCDVRRPLCLRFSLRVQGYMVLLWVYRAAEIQKNLLAKITADTLPHQVCVCARARVSVCVCVCVVPDFSPAIHESHAPSRCRVVVYPASSSTCCSCHLPGASRRLRLSRECSSRTLLVSFRFFPRFFVSKSIVRPGTSVASCLAAPISALACRHTLVLQPSYQQQPRQVPVSTKSHVTT